jgi:hypothetical protein
MRKEYLLVFKDKTTGEEWHHLTGDWILLFCCFNTSIHPSLMTPWQKMTTKDTKGNLVEITCIKNEGA